MEVRFFEGFERREKLFRVNFRDGDVGRVGVVFGVFEK